MDKSASPTDPAILPNAAGARRNLACEPKPPAEADISAT